MAGTSLTDEGGRGRAESSDSPDSSSDDDRSSHSDDAGDHDAGHGAAVDKAPKAADGAALATGVASLHLYGAFGLMSLSF